jgi:hypothetical protein
MPTTIPYDPSLVLGNIINATALDTVKKIAEQQAKVDAQQESLNSLVASRRSLDMTKTELINLKVDVKGLEKLNTEIGATAASYATTKIAAEGQLKGLRAKLVGVHSSLESPVDFNKTVIKTLPLAQDSLNMDVQYFSNDANSEDSQSLSERISKFVSVQTSWMGVKKSAEASASASSQVSRQTKKHSVTGTLVLSVSCTRKNAQVLAPFVLDVDKGIKVWNSLFGAIKADKLDPTSQKGMMAIANDDYNAKDTKEPEKKYSIISGMTFGSSFIGMVHVLKTTETTSSQDMTAMAANLQAQMNTGSWFANASGEFGVNASMANDVKNLLSSQNITSHVTLICMGVIPSMVANDVKIGVEKFATNDPKANMEALATLQNAAQAGQDSIKQSAATARTGQQMISMKAGEVKAALSALAEIDDGANKILDINSMMGAFDDYLKKAAEGTSGIPINYYLKDITKAMLAEMWVAKYFPGEYMQIKHDDSPVNSAATPAAAPAAGTPVAAAA